MFRRPHSLTHLGLLGALAIAAATLGGCMRWDYAETETIATADHGLFVLCEGNFQYGNSTLSFYNPATGHAEDELFARANGFRLGDVAQSMQVRGSTAWIVVNNSHVVFAIDATTCREQGRIEGMPSPRYMLFLSDTKAYVSQLWDNRIFIVDPSRRSVTGTIEVPGMDAATGSTEQMVRVGQYVYCTCWSYQNRIIRIDTAADCVDGSVEVGIQPRSLVADAEGMLWTITDGGYAGSPAGSSEAALVRVDPSSLTVTARYPFRVADAPAGLTVSADGRSLYWINGNVYSMAIDAPRLPWKPLVDTRGTRYYALTVSPADGDIYIADAIDYQQAGMVRRYSPEGVLKDEFYAGVTPGAFAWK